MLGYFGLGYIGIGQGELGYVGLGYVGLGQVRQGQVRMDQVRLGQVRVGEIVISNNSLIYTHKNVGDLPFWSNFPLKNYFFKLIFFKLPVLIGGQGGYIRDQGGQDYKLY